MISPKNSCFSFPKFLNTNRRVLHSSVVIELLLNTFLQVGVTDGKREKWSSERMKGKQTILSYHLYQGHLIVRKHTLRIHDFKVRSQGEKSNVKAIPIISTMSFMTSDGKYTQIQENHIAFSFSFSNVNGP